MADLEERVLSIQSHVVSGYVGNKSAIFPLQILGFEVDAINSVQFSNHTGYAKGVKGQVLNDEQLWELIVGLQENDLDRYSHIINGYIGSTSFLLKLAEVIKAMKKRNPNLVYVCDPVMGDIGPGMYVPEEVLPIYRKEIIDLADVCLPNQFEAELLTEMKINNEEDAIRVMQMLHNRGVKIVVLSSTELGSDTELVAFASKSCGNGDNQIAQAVKINIPKLPIAFVGSGDLFTALISAWLHKSNGNLQETLEKAIASMQAVLKRTLDHAMAVTPKGQNPKPSAMELKLIQSKGNLENPDVKIKAIQIVNRPA